MKRLKRLLVAALILLMPAFAWAMTEAELLTALGTKYSKVGEPQASSRRGDNPVMLGSVNYTEKEVWACDQLEDGALRCSLIRYRVADTGEAFWSGSEPKAVAVSTFADEVRAVIKFHLDGGTILWGQIFFTDEVNKYALVDVNMNDAANGHPAVRFYLKQNTDGTWQLPVQVQK